MTLLAAGSSLAATRTWTGAAGTTVINTPGNWSEGAAPSAPGDIALWDGTVRTNEPFVWDAGFGPGSGNAGSTAFHIGSGYTTPFVLMNSGAGGNLALSNITIFAGAGPFTLGSNGISSVTVFRGNSNSFLNFSANPARIADSVQFNNGGGTPRTVEFGGSGDWISDAGIYAAGAGTISLRVNGTGANTLLLNAGSFANPANHSIANGTLALGNGDALGSSGTLTVTIDGGMGTKRLALTNSIFLSPAIVNINVAGRDEVAGAANAAVLSSGDNIVNGTIRFNAVGGTNIGIFNQSGTLTLNGDVNQVALTAANVAGARYISFDGPGTSVVQGTIVNGSAALGLRLWAGNLILNNVNTHTGDTLISGGVLTLGNDLALQNSAVVMSGGTLDVNGAMLGAPVIGGLAGNGVVNTLSGGAPTLTVGNNNASTVFSGSINNASGSLRIQKAGTGTLTLSGASTYSGGTTVSAGTLLVNNTTGSATGSGAVDVNSGAVLGGSGIIQGSVNWQAGSSGSFVVTPSTGAGSNSTVLTVSGPVTLSGNAVVVHVPGNTPLQVGTYRLMAYSVGGSSGAFDSATPTYTGAGVALGTASSITTSGGFVTLTVSFTGATSVWTNNNNGNWSAGANWSSNPYYPQASGDAATLGVGSAFRTVTLDVDASVGTLSFTNNNSFLVANSGKVLSFANPSGPAVLAVQAGASNTIAAPVRLDSDLAVATTAGTVIAVTNSISNGSGQRTVSLSGAGTLALSGNNSYGPGAGSVGTTLAAGSVLQLGSSSAIGSGDLSVAGNSTVRASAPLNLANNIIANSGATAVVDNNGNSVTLSGNVSGAGNFSKDGAGTLTLSSANSYTGNTIVNAGTLRLGVSGAVPGGFGQGNVSVNTNGVLDLNGLSHTFNALAGAGTVDSLVGGAMTLTLGENGANGTFTGNIRNTAGTIALVKNGAGTQTLAGTNTYSGGTTIASGTLQIGNGGTGGTLAAGSVVNNGFLVFNNTVSNVIPNVISGSGELILANPNMNLLLSGANTFAGNVSINSGHLWVSHPSALGTGPKTVFSVGGGVSALTTLHLAGNVTIDSSISYQLSYFGGALVNESGNNTLLGDIGLPFGGGAAYIDSRSGLLVLGGTISAINGGRTLLLGGVANGQISGSISDGGVGGAIGAVIKTNSGTWSLTGNNSSATTLSVLEGTIVLNGSYSGAITVNSNATLSGTGMAFSTVTWQPGARAGFTVNNAGGANSTPFTVAGTATINNNTVEVNIAGGTPLPAGSYTLMSAGSLGGVFASTPVITGAGIAANTFASIVTANGSVTLMIVPNSVWVNNGNGNWSTPANWSSNPNVPDTAGEFATFGFGSSLTTVSLDSAKTVGGIAFTNANSFVISSPVNTLTLNNNGNTATISVSEGTANAISTRVDATENVVVSVAAAKSLSISGAIGGGGGLSKAGDGFLALSGSNAFASSTVLSGGTLALGSTNAIGTGLFTINGGSLDSLVPNLINRNNNPQNWNGNFGFVGSQNLNLGDGPVSLLANLTLAMSSNTLVIGGPIDGAATLTVSGTTNSTLVLNGNNSFTGLTVLGGTIALGTDTALGSAATVQLTPTIGLGVTLRSTDATPRTIGNGISVNSFDGPYILDGPGNLTFTGTIATGNGQKRFTVNNTTTFAGPITDGGAPTGPVIIDGVGRLVLPLNNTLTKVFQISGATVVLSDPMALGSGPLVLNGGALDTTVPDLTLAANNVQTWGGNFGFAGTENLNLGGGAVTLTSNVTVTVSNKVLTVGGVVSGSFALTKAGAGRLVLNGANNYGNTVVTGGTLEIAQATLRTNATVTISSGGVLQLNFSTTNTVSGLILNGVAQPAGVYKSGTSGGLIAGAGALRVVPLGPAAPATLTSTWVGNQLNLSWPAGQGWRLQAQTNTLSTGLSNNWVYITDGNANTANITVEKSAPAVFFRLVYP